MDGQGLTATAQFGRLSTAFDLHMLQLVPEDRSTFDSLVKLSLVSWRGGCSFGFWLALALPVLMLMLSCWLPHTELPGGGAQGEPP